MRSAAVAAVLALVATGCVYFERVSLDANGDEIVDASVLLDVSGDGRYVLISTRASLVAGDTNTLTDFYRKDTRTGALVWVSQGATGAAGNGEAQQAEMSDDGRWVAFASAASNLIAVDGNSDHDVFLRDVDNQTTTRVSERTGGVEVMARSSRPAISGDGNVIAWESDGEFVAGQTNGSQQVWAHNVSLGVTALVSAAAGATIGDDESGQPTVDFNGSAVAFDSVATNLVVGDTNGARDIFVKYPSGVIARVSTASGGTQANLSSALPSLAGDGFSVAFESYASNLVVGDNNAKRDVFVKSLSGAIERVSVADNGDQGNDESYFPFLDHSGSIVTFISESFNINGGPGGDEVPVVRDLANQRTWRAGLKEDGSSSSAFGGQAATRVSADGNYVVWATGQSDVVSGDTNGVFDVFQRWWSDATVASLSPSSTGVGTVTPVTISGDGFRPGHPATVTTNLVAPCSDGITFTNVVAVDETTITADLQVLGSANPGLRWVNVEQKGTGPGATAGSFTNCQCLTITP